MTSKWNASIDGPNLRQARINRNFTQKQAADLLGVTQSAFSSWETGRSAPRARQLERVKSEFGAAPITGSLTGTGHWDRSVHGVALRNARLQAALTQAEVARAVRVAQPTIANWELGKSSPKSDQIATLEELLGSFAAQQSTDEEAAAPPILGAWVNKNRSERKWTVPQLAKRAGITPAAIYRIESGKTSNVQRKTLERLEKAFGNKLERETKRELSREATVEGIGELEDFDPHDDDDLPTGAGVYVLYDVSERPIYVGMSGNVRNRLRDHQQKFWFKRPIVQSASYVAIDDERRRREIEVLLIKFLKSNAVLNKTNTDR